MMILESIFIDYGRENDSIDSLAIWHRINLCESFKDNCVLAQAVRRSGHGRSVCAKSALQNYEEGRKNKETRRRDERSNRKSKKIKGFIQYVQVTGVKKLFLSVFQYITVCYIEKIHLNIKFNLHASNREIVRSGKNKPFTYFKAVCLITSPRKFCLRSCMLFVCLTPFNSSRAVRRCIFDDTQVSFPGIALFLLRFATTSVTLL